MVAESSSWSAFILIQDSQALSNAKYNLKPLAMALVMSMRRRISAKSVE